MKALLASLLAAVFALAALSSYTAPAAAGMSAAPHTLAAGDDDDKDKDKEGGKKSD